MWWCLPKTPRDSTEWWRSFHRMDHGIKDKRDRIYLSRSHQNDLWNRWENHRTSWLLRLHWAYFWARANSWQHCSLALQTLCRLNQISYWRRSNIQQNLPTKRTNFIAQIYYDKYIGQSSLHKSKESWSPSLLLQVVIKGWPRGNIAFKMEIVHSNHKKPLARFIHQ